MYKVKLEDKTKTFEDFQEALGFMKENFEGKVEFKYQNSKVVELEFGSVKVYEDGSVIYSNRVKNDGYKRTS